MLWAGLVVLVVWGLFPFRHVLAHYPWGADGVKWVTQGALDNPDWLGWVFTEHHFVGYRPFTAGSFTLNHALASYSPWMYRATDLGLHGLSALAVAALLRRLMGTPTLWMWLATSLFVGHPAVEEVVPLVARRSYLLATLFGTLGLCLWVDGVKQAGRFNRRLVAATVCIGLALLSNEIAFVLLVMLPLLSFHETWDTTPPRETLLRCLPPWMLAVPMVGARWATLGWSGGYVRHYFAYARNGKKHLTQVNDFNFDHIVAAAFEYLWFPVSASGQDAWIAGGWLGMVGVGGFYVAVVGIEPWFQFRVRERRLPLLLGVWILGYALLFGLSKTWFWRQGYALLAPFSILFCVVASTTWSRFRNRPVLLALRMVPQALLLIAVFAHSPLFRGMNVSRYDSRVRGSQVIAQLGPALAAIEGPATVHAVLPLKGKTLQPTENWLARLYGPRDIQVRALAHGLPRKGIAQLQGVQVAFGEQAKVDRRYARSVRRGNTLLLSALSSESRTAYIAVPHGRTRWRVHRVDNRKKRRSRNRRP